MSPEQLLLMQAVDAYITATNRFVELHNLVRHKIKTPFDPRNEIMEIYWFQLKELFEYLAVINSMDITVRTTFLLRKPRFDYAK